jgi:hypothetical protein
MSFRPVSIAPFSGETRPSLPEADGHFQITCSNSKVFRPLPVENSEFHKAYRGV